MKFSPPIQQLVDRAEEQRRKSPKPVELLVGRALSQRGTVLARITGYGLKSVMSQLDAAVPKCWRKTVRGEWTSDGTYRGPDRGRLLASREAVVLEPNGVKVFHDDWLLE